VRIPAREETEKSGFYRGPSISFRTPEMQARGKDMKQVAANEWKVVEKLAVEVALHPETFVGGDAELASNLAQSTQHLFNLGTLHAPLSP
jgi:hypothetical protein